MIIAQRAYEVNSKAVQALAPIDASGHQYDGCEAREAVCLQFAAGFDARETGHHHIEEHEVGRILEGEPKRIGPVERDTDVVSRGDEKIAHPLRRLLVVVNHKNLFDGFHPASEPVQAADPFRPNAQYCQMPIPKSVMGVQNRTQTGFGDGLCAEVARSASDLKSGRPACRVPNWRMIAFASGRS